MLNKITGEDADKMILYVKAKLNEFEQ